MSESGIGYNFGHVHRNVCLGKVGNKKVEHGQILSPGWISVSRGWLGQEQGPLLTKQILGRHVMKTDVTVGEDNKAGLVEARP